MSDECKLSIDQLNAGALPPQPIVPVVTPTAPVTLVPNGTAIGKDCAGDDLPAVPTHGTFKTIPDPTAVQNVKVCGPIASLKIEFSETLLFSASTEQSIYRIREYNEDAGTWTTRYENLDGTPFTGALPADLNRVSALVNVTRTQVLGCAAGVPYAMRETARFDAETGALESEVIDWVNSAGLVQITAPAGFVFGECKPCEVTKHFEFLGYTTPATNGLQPKVLGFFQGINADFSQSTIGDYEVVFTIDGASQAGNAAGTIWPGDYPVPSTGIQSFADYLNNHPANTAPKDIWSAAGTTGNEALVIAATAVGNPPNHVWGGVAFAHYTAGAHDYMTIKGDPTSADVEITVPASCRKIEVLKEVDCNRNLALFGFELDGTPIAGFDPKNLVTECLATQQKNRIYLQRNVGILTLADINATIGAGKIVSVTVKQISGMGQVSGDSGLGAPLDTTETWEWGEKDFLDGSLLSMNAGTGEQRITAVYVI